jgi:hypothetical protein
MHAACFMHAALALHKRFARARHSVAHCLSR